MSSPDPMRMQNEARRAVIERLAEERKRSAERLVSEPAASEPMSKEERRLEWLEAREDPLVLGAKLDEQAARWKLRPHKPIPRNVVQWALEEEAALQRDIKAGRDIDAMLRRGLEQRRERMRRQQDGLR